MNKIESDMDFYMLLNSTPGIIKVNSYGCSDFYCDGVKLFHINSHSNNGEGNTVYYKNKETIIRICELLKKIERESKVDILDMLEI